MTDAASTGSRGQRARQSSRQSRAVASASDERRCRWQSNRRCTDACERAQSRAIRCVPMPRSLQQLDLSTAASSFIAAARGPQPIARTCLSTIAHSIIALCCCYLPPQLIEPTPPPLRLRIGSRPQHERCCELRFRARHHGQGARGDDHRRSRCRAVRWPST